MRGLAPRTGARIPSVAGPTSLLLLHANSAGLIDNSPYRRIITAHGAAAYDPERARFGSGSLGGFSDDTRDYMSCAASADWNTGLPGRVLQVDTWVWLDSAANVPHVFEFGNDLNNRTGVCISGGKLACFSIVSGVNVGLVDAGTFPLGQWAHVAMTIGAGQLSLYKAGLRVGTVARNTYNATQNLFIGNQPYSDPSSLVDQWVGNIDEFHVTENLNISGASYTLPTRPYRR